MSDLLNDVLSALPSIIFRTDRNGKLIWWNHTTERMAKTIWNSEAQEGILLGDGSQAWENEQIVKGFTECVRTGAQTPINDVRFKRDDGREGFLGFNLCPVTGDERPVEAVIWFGADITQRKELQSQVRQNQKLEAVGQLAGGIAHEINTPLQYICDNIDFALNGVDDLMGKLCSQFLELLALATSYQPLRENAMQIEQTIDDIDLDFLREEVPKALSQSREGLEQITQIVSAMKAFAGPGGDETGTCDLRELIENALTLSRNEWRGVAQIKTDFDRSMPKIHCYPSLLNQVILNLILNAVHAIAEKRTLEKEDFCNEISIRTAMAGDTPIIELADTGTGIPAVIKERIFEPFFTTKDVGEGTGQGLAFAHSVIVDKHGGEIRVDSKPNEGTCFTIRLGRAKQTDQGESIV